MARLPHANLQADVVTFLESVAVFEQIKLQTVVQAKNGATLKAVRNTVCCISLSISFDYFCTNQLDVFFC